MRIGGRQMGGAAGGSGRPLSRAMRKRPGRTVELAHVDRGYTGETPAAAAKKQGIELSRVKLPKAKRGFVLLPRRWMVERSFA